VLTATLTVCDERIVAASPEVLGNQRKAGKRHTLELYNTSGNIVYFGGETVTVENGMPLLPDERRIFRVDDPFALYLIAEKESDVRMAEYCV